DRCLLVARGVLAGRIQAVDAVAGDLGARAGVGAARGDVVEARRWAGRVEQTARLFDTGAARLIGRAHRRAHVRGVPAVLTVWAGRAGRDRRRRRGRVRRRCVQPPDHRARFTVRAGAFADRLAPVVDRERQATTATESAEVDQPALLRPRE